MMKFGVREKSVHTLTAVILVTAGCALVFSGVESVPFTTSTTSAVSGENTHPHTMCSVLTVSHKGKVFLGGNADTEPYDYSGTAPYIFFYPAKTEPQEYGTGYGSGYGFVALGWEWKENTNNHESHISSMNEKGLAYGANGLPEVPLNPHPERPFSVFSESFWIKAMRECSDVTGVIELAEKFDWGNSSRVLEQHHFADSTGAAVVISGGKDGELAFTRKDAHDTYIISTNFNRANPENGKYPCWRYDTAVKMLEDIEGDLAISHVESILDAMHVESILGNTTCSYIFDLNNRDVYIYYFHQFDDAVKFNLTEVLASDLFSDYDSKICTGYRFPELFSQETHDRIAFEVQQRLRRFNLVAALSVAAVLSISFFVYKKSKK